PSALRTLNSCASVASTNAVAMPTMATTHIQNTAPGPPSTSATLTPAMLPVPTREASPTQNAWNDEMPPSAPERDDPTARIIAGSSRIWTARVRIVMYTPTPISRYVSTQVYRLVLSQSTAEVI